MGEMTFGALLGAMIKERREAGGFTQLELAEQAFPDGDADSKARRIRELEAEGVNRPQAKNYQPICEVLSIDRATIRALKVEAADAIQQNKSEIEEVVSDYGSTEAALSDPSRLKSYELALLAGLFGGTSEDATKGELTNFLTKKAEEYRALKAEVDAIPDSMKRLANLKSAAQDAIRRVDLDEVENLMSMVHEAELEEAAKSAEIRANNALLRGNVEQAYALLESAANSFMAVDHLEPARRKIYGYNQILKDHARRYGGVGLLRAIDMIGPLLTDALRNTAPDIWGQARTRSPSLTKNKASAPKDPQVRTFSRRPSPPTATPLRSAPARIIRWTGP